MTKKFRHKTATKDPDDILDYSIVWHKWLESIRDTIIESEWIVEQGITNVGSIFDDEKTTIWLSGGTDKKNYRVTNRIRTAGGRQADRTFIIRVRNV